MKVEYLTLHLGDQLGKSSKLGTGFRDCLVWAGRKHATIFDPFTLKHEKVPVEAKRAGRLIINHGLDTLRSTPRADFNPKRLRKLIKEKIEHRKALGIYDGGSTAEKALELLKEAA